jgi:hypothetical protein
VLWVDITLDRQRIDLGQFVSTMPVPFFATFVVFSGVIESMSVLRWGQNPGLVWLMPRVDRPRQRQKQLINYFQKLLAETECSSLTRAAP